MSEPYNLTLLANADGWVEYLLVFNYWSSLIWFTGITLVFVLIVYTTAKYNLAPTPVAGTLACFMGFLVSSLMWIFVYAGEHAVPLLLPFMLLFATAWGVVILKLESY